ncbi:hypothetical protein [Tardiphaga sp. 285_C5_N1_2]|uniref:hypothetical protein n=1 Tax=Tardiphaga sp. 285_C5_N1_2 TaxID=3240775 RepID=UPI003F8BB34C
MVLDDWSALQLRLSLFSDAILAPTEAAWTRLTGQSEAENRIALPGVPGGRQYSGELMGGLLALTFNLNRIDVILTGNPNITPEVASAMRFPTIGKWPESSQLFAKMVAAFTEQMPERFTRIAFGAHIVAEADSKEASYGILATMLKSVTVDPGKMRELQFRINWPEQSKVDPGLEINRITAWSSLSITSGLLQTSNQGLAGGPVSTVNVASLEIDNNTSADRKEPIEKPQILPIFEELLALANQNASSGERP